MYTGCVSNGAYNSMRANGYTRPLSIFAIIAKCHSKYSKMSCKDMTAMLTPSTLQNIWIKNDPKIWVKILQLK